MVAVSRTLGSPETKGERQTYSHVPLGPHYPGSPTFSGYEQGDFTYFSKERIKMEEFGIVVLRLFDLPSIG